MKIIKKIIILLFMIIGILIIGISKVDATPSLPDASKIKYNKVYYVSADMYLNRNHLFCVQHGFFMHDPGTTYTLYKKISIENSIATITDKDSSADLDTSNKNLYKKDYNKVLATGIAKYDEDKDEGKKGDYTKLQAFLWGYMDTWVTEVGWYEGIDNEFARGSKVSKEGQKDAKEVEKEIDEATGDILDLEDITEYDKLNIGTLNFSGTNYRKIGPYKITGVPTSGINQISIEETNGNSQGIKIVRNIDDEWKEVTKKSNTKIANNKPFYILIPMNSNAIKGSVEFKTSKKGAETVRATIYLLKSEKDEWQNLAIATGKVKEKDSPASVTVNFELPANGKIKIYKKVLINGQPTDIPIEGAGFVVYRYAKNSKGSWVKDGADYYRPATDEEKKNSEVQKYRREYVKKGNGCFTYDGNIGYKNIIDLETGQHQDDYIFYTNGLGEVPLDYLVEDTYYAQECVLPQEYINNLDGELISYGECYTGNLKIDGQDKWRWDNILLGEVSANDEKEITMYNIPKSATSLKLLKVNKDNPNVTISGVQFRLKHKKFGWIQITNNGWQFTSDENSATWIATDNNGEINIPNAPIGQWEWHENLASRPYGYDPEDPSSGEFAVTEDKENNVCEIKVTNKQKWVKLSGFVWLDDSGSKGGDAKDNNNLFKTPNDGTDASDLLFDGIQVRVMDGNTGTIAKDKNGNDLVTTTGQVNRTEENPGYLENEGHNGHGQYLFKDVEIDKLHNYYIEFTYDGLNYTNVLSYNEDVSKVNPWPNNASKAKESEQGRANLNEKYAIIKNDGAYNSNNEKTINLGDNDYEVENYEEGKPKKISTYTGYRESNYDYKYDESWIAVNKDKLDLNNVPYSIQANTNETGYKLKTDFNKSEKTDGFQWGETEVQYINLGLKTRYKPWIQLGKDIDNVKVSINGKNHIYQYSSRYNNENPTEEDANVGVKFKDNFSGDYLQAVYQADYNYVNENKLDNELKVYVTYDLNMKQFNQNLQANVNSIVDYFDQTYVREGIDYKDYIKVYYKETDENGNFIKDENGQEIEKEITDWKVENYTNSYKKLSINNNTRLDKNGVEKHVFITFQLSRGQIKDILRGKNEGDTAEEILDNVAEITSYSILDDKGKTYAAVDQYSRPENCDPENENTFELDTSSSPGLQLEVANAREMKGTVFIDNHDSEKYKGNPDEIMTGQIRQGNGIYDEGEATVDNVTVEIRKANIDEETGEVTPGDIVQVFDSTSNKEEEKENWIDSTTQTGKDNIGAGNFYISNYIPGDYVITYTWGGQTYVYKEGKTRTITVQDYKGTIYPEPNRQIEHLEDGDKKRWWHVSIDENGNKVSENPEYKRYTDAIDDYQQRIDIDNQILKIDKDTNDTINNAYDKEKKNDNETITTMQSTTPLMKIGVEFDSTFSEDLTESRFAYCINDIDFGIIERAKQELALKKRISKMKVTLANGQVIADLTVDKNGKLDGEFKGITYMKPDDNNSQESKYGFIRLELDNELIQGTKLEVQYEIEVTNNSERDYIPKDGREALFYKYGIKDNQEEVTMSPTGIIDYLDNSWSFDMQASENNEKWQVLKVNDDSGRFKELVKENVYNISNNENTIGEKMILYTEALKDEKIKPENSKSIYLDVSKILTTTNDISLNNEIEEVTITRTGGPTLPPTPGNYVPGTGPQETDEGQAETAVVTPATGEDLNYIIPIVVGTTALIILGAGIIIIKKKVI